MNHTAQHMVSFDIIVLKDFSQEQDFGAGKGSRLSSLTF
jgi:hypothetical protein